MPLRRSALSRCAFVALLLFIASAMGFVTQSAAQPGAPVLDSPADGQSCVAVSTPLVWRSVFGAVSYEVTLYPQRITYSTVDTQLVPPGLVAQETYQWDVVAIDTRGAAGPPSRRWSFDTGIGEDDAPVPVAPAGGQFCLGTSVDFAWQSVPNAGSYDLRISVSGEGSILNYSVDSSPVSIPGLPADAVLEWEVRAEDTCGYLSGWSAPITFGTYPALGAPALPVFPPDGAACLPVAFTLDWSDVPGATQYDVRYGPLGDFTDTITTQDSAGPINGLNLDGEYAWQVRAVDSCGNQGDWSAVFTFRTQVSTVVVPTLIAPLDGTPYVDQPATLRWSPIPDAASYAVEITPSPGGVYQIQGTELTVPDLEVGPTYSWRVRAENVCGSQSVWSPPATFSFYQAAASTAVPQRTALLGNYPNPFNPRTTIRFTLAQAGPVELSLYDVAGRQVRRLVAGSLGTGLHERVWNGTDDTGRSLTSGKYFLRLRAGDFVATGSLVLVR